MAEQVDLTTPEPQNPNYRVWQLKLDWIGQAIYILLRGAQGQRLSHTYTGATALTLMNQLNTANLSTQSLHKRILNRLITDGVLSGTVSGSPD